MTIATQAGFDRQGNGGIMLTLDDLFHRSLSRRPDALALADPPDKSRITGQRPQRLSFAQADRAISTLAAHFLDAGLPAGSVIGVQLPNTVEAILTVMAAFRAGLVAALLPQLWRHAELTDALNRTRARALVTTSRIDGVCHADLALRAAVETFSIRHVCAFGEALPEGIAPLDDVLAGAPEPRQFPARDPRAAAIITFDVTAEGLRAIPRNQLQLSAGGLAIMMESQLRHGEPVLSTVMPSSFAGLCASLATWLLGGGAMVLHHPMDLTLLLRQLADEACATLIAPAPLVLRLDEAGAFTAMRALRSVVAIWRTPEQVASSRQWSAEQALTDLSVFGEAGLLATCREDGAPAPVFPGPQGSPREPGSPAVGEVLITPNGTVGLRGPMAPTAAYIPARDKADTSPAATAIDYVDTGYAVRLDRRTAALCITAAPAGLVSVGGYRFRSRDLDGWAQRLSQGAMLTALPDRISGYRLAGRAIDNARARTALAELGLNPLMIEAFRDRVAS